MKKRVLILRGNAMISDPRVEKVIDILSPSYELSILAFDRSGVHPTRDSLRGVSVRRFHGIKAFNNTKLKSINAFLYQCFLFFKALTEGYEIIHACDFKTFAPAVIPVKLRGKKIAYDIFDFFFDMVFTLPAFVKRWLINLDLFTMRLADVVILADDTRKDQVQAKRLKDVIVFYNSPDDVFGSTTTFENNHPVESSALNLIYVGLVDNRKRDFQFALNVLAQNKHVGMDVYGAGRDYEPMAKKYAKYPNIRFMGKVPYSEILNVEAAYDAVFAVYDPSIPNNVLASPNKLFEAMMLSKPVLLNEEVVAAKLIKDHDIGYTYPFNNEVAFSALLEELLNNPELVKAKGKNGRALYLTRFGFNKQREVLLSAYASMSKD